MPDAERPPQSEGSDADRPDDSLRGSGGRPFDAPGPTRIGRYAIVRVLGQGGMGTVYEAQQDNPRRAVALKVIRAEHLSPELLRRFTKESQVLARLHHAGIAQVYEAGVARDERGQALPFFAMEFIQGVTLTEHVRAKRLDTRARLELIARVADAVEHAHQKGVIHRDLKPGNILVDGSGQPKVLDFGIARATDGDLRQTTMRTDVGQLIGTVPYMSPEQVSGDPSALDTRSDVYALGVIAYEVLAGRLPYDLERKMIHDAVRIIREEEPTHLSSVDRTLRGDVETIVGKALEKDKLRRYASADSFASDIRRYLADEPIAARPASTWYQLAKFSRRNKGLVAGVGTALVLLIAGVLGTSIALRRALKAEGDLTLQLDQTEAARAESDRQRELAETNAAAEARARARAESINAFVTKALQSGDAMDEGRRDATIAQAMEGAVREIESGAFSDDPETEASLLGTIGVVLKNDGKYARARPVLERALAMSERLLGDDSPAVAQLHKDLGQLLLDEGELALAEPHLERALALLEKAYGPDHIAVTNGLSGLAQLYHLRGEPERAQPLYERSLAISERVRGPNHRDVARDLNDLALVRQSLQRYAEAEPLLQRSLAIFEATLGPDHPDVAASLNSLALLYEEQGDFARAEPLYVRALSICEKALGPDHPLVSGAQHNLAELYRTESKYALAEPLYVRALASREKSFGPEHPEVAVVLNNLGMLHRAQGRFADAEPLFERVVAIDEKAYGPDDVEVARDLNNLARTRHALGKRDEARSDFDRAIDILRRQSDGGSVLLARVLWISAKTRLENEDAEGALPELEEAVPMAERLGDEQVGELQKTLAACRAELGL